MSGLFGLADSGSLVYFTNAVRSGWLVGINRLPVLIAPLKYTFNTSSWMLRASVFQVSYRKYVSQLKHRRYTSVEEEGFVLAPLFSEHDEWPVRHFTRVSSHIYQMTLLCVLPFHPL